ncbi:hypothetical protein Thiowin_00601 [Thiorhodovibrio winogradskyi]|uniref:Uncharacterized protein n=1 Tax=Thiorhodovibrio winogradskyi TaxID=77007 RepID=A0ABZ0S616_9GAMM|nr:hypothetical protein [Thiorhodovibrio winogradskyi]
MTRTRVPYPLTLGHGFALAAALGVSLSASAWEPADASKTADPGWYRAGETLPYVAPYTGSAPGYSGASGYKGGRASNWNDGSAHDAYGRGNADGDSSRHQWVAPGATRSSGVGADYQVGAKSSVSPHYPSALDEQTGFDNGANPTQWRESDWYSPYGASYDAEASGYHFRGDNGARQDWQVPAGSWGAQQGGYSFREDKRLESRMPANVSDSRFRFRPLEP